MNVTQRLNAFIELGLRLSKLTESALSALTSAARANNSWFIPQNVEKSLEGIVHMLQKDQLKSWVDSYSIVDQNKKIGLVMAGNIPLVGFHDLLAVLISGNKVHAKLSKKDTVLMEYIIQQLTDIDPYFADAIQLKDMLKEIDAIIATGSDNSSRYFEYYFSKYPHVIRKNKTSLAILNGSENKEDLENLADDIFLYFGLGCRNVSKLLVPAGYQFNKFFEAMEKHKEVIHHHKYCNNYDYNKSIYLINGIPHLDNGFLMLKEDNTIVSPVSVVFYQAYNNHETLNTIIKDHENKTQCIVSSNAWWPNSKAFGKAQFPDVRDYADGVDTLKFLTGL